VYRGFEMENNYIDAYFPTYEFLVEAVLISIDVIIRPVCFLTQLQTRPKLLNIFGVYLWAQLCTLT